MFNASKNRRDSPPPVNVGGRALIIYRVAAFFTRRLSRKVRALRREASEGASGERRQGEKRRRPGGASISTAFELSNDGEIGGDAADKRKKEEDRLVRLTGRNIENYETKRRDVI